MLTLVSGMSNFNSWQENQEEVPSKKPGNTDLEMSQPQNMWKKQDLEYISSSTAWEATLNGC